LWIQTAFPDPQRSFAVRQRAVGGEQRRFAVLERAVGKPDGSPRFAAALLSAATALRGWGSLFSVFQSGSVEQRTGF
jgi:hypothetical protein